jgi:hypothetical protein
MDKAGLKLKVGFKRKGPLPSPLLGNSTNQSFAVYRSPDFFNTIAPKRPPIFTLRIGAIEWKAGALDMCGL